MFFATYQRTCATARFSACCTGARISVVGRSTLVLMRYATHESIGHQRARSTGPITASAIEALAHLEVRFHGIPRMAETAVVLAFNWKHEHGTLLAVGSRDAYALNIVSLEKAPASAPVWSTWAPWRRDAEAYSSRGLCEPHILAVEPNAHTNWITDIKFSHDDSEVLRFVPNSVLHLSSLGAVARRMTVPWLCTMSSAARRKPPWSCLGH